MGGESIVNKREHFFLMRRRKRIKLKEIAAHIGISATMLSKYENNIKNLQPDKERKYEQYIINN